MPGHLTWANRIVPFAGRDVAGLLAGLKVAPCDNGDQGLGAVKQKLMIIWVGEKISMIIWVCGTVGLLRAFE